jgi:hypothetical protein
MRIVLKPAGMLIIGGLITLAGTVVVVRAQQEELRKVPELGPIEGFQSKKKESAPQSVFNSKEEMGSINISQFGTKDWVVWGVDKSKNPIRKAVSNKLISDYELIQPNQKVLAAGKRGPTRAMLWTDGKPVAKKDAAYPGIHVDQNNGFRFTVPASTELQKLRVFVGGYKAGGDFAAFTTDGSAVKIEKEDLALGEGYYSRTYTVDFKATAPNQNLTVIWRMSSGSGGNVSLQGAALE